MLVTISAVSLQKSVRDQLEDIPVTAIYYGLCWASVIIAIVLLVVGLWNATLTLSEKGTSVLAFVLSLFAAITVQKNTRDSTLSAPKRALQANLPERALGGLSANNASWSTTPTSAAAQYAHASINLNVRTIVS